LTAAGASDVASRTGSATTGRRPRRAWKDDREREKSGSYQFPIAAGKGWRQGAEVSFTAIAREMAAFVWADWAGRCPRSQLLRLRYKVLADTYNGGITRQQTPLSSGPVSLRSALAW